MDRVKLEKILPVKPSEIFWEKIQDYPVDLIPLSREERDNCILKIIHAINDENIVKAGRKRQEDWFRGWEENFKNYCSSKNKKDLIPKYYNKYEYLRYEGDLYKVKNKYAELNTVRILINFITDIYLKDFENIIELGAGTCHHLLEISEILENNTNFFALDWSEATQMIANEIKDIILFNQYIHLNLISLIQNGIVLLNYQKEKKQLFTHLLLLNKLGKILEIFMNLLEMKSNLKSLFI